jgi:hypothetical protein
MNWKQKLVDLADGPALSDEVRSKIARVPAKNIRKPMIPVSFNHSTV